MDVALLEWMAVVFGATGALLIFGEFIFVPKDEEQQAVRDGIQSLLDTIKASQFKRLHKVLIERFVSGAGQFNELLIFTFNLRWFWALSALLSLAGGTASFLIMGADASMAGGFFIPLFLIAVFQFTFPKIISRYENYQLGLAVFLYLGIHLYFVWRNSDIVVRGALSGDQGSSFGQFLLFLPYFVVLSYAIAMSVSFASHRLIGAVAPYYRERWFFKLADVRTYVVVCLAMIVSVLVSFAALWLGKNISTRFDIDPAPTLFISNALFDGATLTITLLLLSVVLRSAAWVLVPAVAVDILFSAAFAIGSLYFGLLDSATAVTVSQSVNVLLFKDPTGVILDFGPMFWLMHTTFLPTLVYLGLIVFFWCAKTFLVFPIEAFLERIVHRAAPLAVAGSLLGAIAFIFQAAKWACEGLAS